AVPLVRHRRTGLRSPHRRRRRHLLEEIPMNGLTFAQPVWFWGLLVLVPLVALRAWAHWHTARQLPGLVSPRLADRLISGSSHRRRWTVFILHCLALAALLTALARPRLGHTE